MKSTVEKELCWLEEQGIIAPVEFSDWAAPIMPVVKKMVLSKSVETID